MELYLSAAALSASTPGSDTHGWRIQFESESNVYPRLGERRTVRLIVWAKAVGNGDTPRWAGEIMVHLLSAAGLVENVAWRLGPGGLADSVDGRSGIENGEWDDWRMAHLVDYYSVDRDQPADAESFKGPENVPEIELSEDRSFLEETVVDAVYKAIREALGEPYQPKKEELRDRMKRISARFAAEGKSITGLEVARKFRKSMGRKRHYLPAAFVLIHAESKVGVGGGKDVDAVRQKSGYPAATIIIDVFTHGVCKLMGVLFAGEEPMVHFYRSRYPPPDPRSILRASGISRDEGNIGGGLGDEEKGLILGVKGLKVSKRDKTRMKLDPVVEDQ